jgi:hypothetical protein
VTPIGRLIRNIEPQGLLRLSDQLVLYGCHHYGLFLDQTITDALGGEGWAVRRQAAFEATHALLASLSGELGAVGSFERLELASALFATMGQGRLMFDVTAEGGSVHGESLFFGGSFAEKYGGGGPTGPVLRNRRPLDAFAAGFCSAAASLAFPSDWGTLEAEEVNCVGRRDDTCSFVLIRRPERPRFGAVVTQPAVEALPLDRRDERTHPEAGRSAADASRMLAGLVAEGGLVRAFGVRLSLLPVSYVDQISFDTMHLIEKRTPELFPVVVALIREAAQIGAFHLLGGVLTSAEWQTEHGPPARDIEVRLEQLLGISRALGWGNLFAEDFIPGRSLVLRSLATHESAYYAIRHGTTVRSRLAFQQGVALAVMQLLTRVDWTASSPITATTYDALFKGSPRFNVEETRSPLRGDGLCEVVVEAIAE